MWRQFLNNPQGKSVGDCAVRAMSAALDISWGDAYTMLCEEGYEIGDMPSADVVWGNVLKNEGFCRFAVPHDCNGCYTAENFCEDNPAGTFVLAFGGHVATVRNGVLMDSWDSSMSCPVYVWGIRKPYFR